jgi:hypothetical protein
LGKWWRESHTGANDNNMKILSTHRFFDVLRVISKRSIRATSSQWVVLHGEAFSLFFDSLELYHQDSFRYIDSSSPTRNPMRPMNMFLLSCFARQLAWLYFLLNRAEQPRNTVPRQVDDQLGQIRSQMSLARR